MSLAAIIPRVKNFKGEGKVGPIRLFEQDGRGNNRSAERVRGRADARRIDAAPRRWSVCRSLLCALALSVSACSKFVLVIPEPLPSVQPPPLSLPFLAPGAAPPPPLPCNSKQVYLCRRCPLIFALSRLHFKNNAMNNT